MTTWILDPTDERVPVRRRLTQRPEHVSGTVGLLDIGKRRGDVLVDRLARLFAERVPGVEVRRYKKPTFTKPAPDDLVSRLVAECNFVVEGLAD